jgi:hypothetical protein
MKSLIIGALTVLILGAIQAYRSRKGKRQTSDTPLFEAGKILYAADKQAFEDFFNLFLADKKKFIAEKEDILEDYFFENDELRTIDILYIFGDQGGKLIFTDWRGEENTREIEEFINQKLNLSPTWTQTDKLRATATEENERDGKYIVKLLKAIDQDLNATNKQLLFFNLGWDAYVYTVLNKATFTQIVKLAPNDFHGADKVR